MKKLRISNIAFENDAVIIGYFSEDDLRVDGRVAVLHQAQISLEHPDYAEDFEHLEHWAHHLLANALDDWNQSLAYVPEDDDPDDEFGSRHS